MNSKQLNRAMIKALRLLVAAALLAALMWSLAPVRPVHAATITITVDTTTDSNDAAYQACDDGTADDCSLRGAISKANADSGNDYAITLPAGTYTLTIGGGAEQNNATGDLDIVSTIVINGAGAGSTTIQAGATDSNGVDRVFHLVNSSGDLTLNDVTARYGRVSGDGGGIYNYDGTVTLNNSALSDNSAGNNGGGIYNNNGTVTLNNSTLSDNSAGNNGGGILNSNGPLTLNNSTLSGNSANTYDGGGIFNSNGTVTLNNSTLSDNSAGQNGGGILNDGTMTVDNSTLSGNSAGQDGGGIYNDDTMTVDNSTLSGNLAGVGGGGIFHYDGTTHLAHSTLTDNTANNWGGGIYRLTDTLNFKNTIVAGNNGSAYKDCYGSPTSLGYNLVGFGTGCPIAGTDQQTNDAQLGPLQDNGGPPDGSGNSPHTYALLSGSPALDAIPDRANGCGTEYTQDQRGAPRPINASCDIGAYEAGAAIWDDGGSGSNWSTAANWSEDTALTTSSVVVFNDTSDANATMDAASTVARLLVDAGYDGVINAGGYGLQIDGPYEQAGGTFTAPAGLMAVSGGFSHTGGTFDPNGGRVVLNNASDQPLSTTFYDLVINDGLLGYWKLDDGAGSTATDASGYGHHGALQHNTAWAADTPSTDFHNPSALRFDGTDDHVSIAGTTDINGLQQFTLAAWVKLDSLPGGYMRFITLGNNKAGLRYSDRDLQFYVQINGGVNYATENDILTSGTWYHVAGTYDGSTMRLYLNGVQQDFHVLSGTVAGGDGVELSGSSFTLDGWTTPGSTTGRSRQPKSGLWQTENTRRPPRRPPPWAPNST